MRKKEHKVMNYTGKEVQKMKLKTGDSAPEFTLESSSGSAVCLGDKTGKGRVFLSFLRYIGCPFCRARIHGLNARKVEAAEAGGSILVVLESTPKRVVEYSAKNGISIPILSDREKKVFALYGVERGNAMALLKPKVLTGTVKLAFRGFMHGMPGGDELQLPADFIIGKNGRVELAHYRTDPTDSLPIDLALAALRGK